MAIEYELSLASIQKVDAIVSKLQCVFGGEFEKYGDVYKKNVDCGSVYFYKNERDCQINSENDYSISANYRLDFRLLSSEVKYEISMVKYLNNLFGLFEFECVLEFNGEFPVILKRNGKVQINHEYDDGSNFPFDELDAPLEIVRMPCQ